MYHFRSYLIVYIMHIQGGRSIMPLHFFPNYNPLEYPVFIWSTIFILSACAVVLLGLVAIVLEEPFK